MKFLYLFVLCVLALVLQPTGAFADERMALVMGNSAYQRAPRLSNSANDANLLAETFKKAGFTVVEAATISPRRTCGARCATSAPRPAAPTSP
jgi:hypothetical protein